nr:myosin-2 heavy chain-like [Nicotiana tomentosiformis]
MVKRRREETEPETLYNTVFVDTNLDTHLALIVSYSDYVSDLKEKIVFEHLRCFPEKRELKISSVKVKRKGHYYHLPDSMLVTSVFEGIKKGWFLSVDASSCDQGLLCITYPQTGADYLLPSDSFKAMAKQKVFDTNEPDPAHGNLASSSIVKHKDVAKAVGEFKSVKPMDVSQELSPRAGPVAKKRKMKHTEDMVNHLVTDTHASKHGIGNDDSDYKIVGNDTTSTNCNEGQRVTINMKLKDASAEPLRNQPSDPSKMPKLGKKKCRMGGSSAEISGVQVEQCGNRNNDTLDETSQSGTIENKVKKLGSKESNQGPTEFNHRDVLKVAIPENSTAHRPIKSALAEALGDQSVGTDTAHKKSKKKKGKDSSMCHDEVACMVLSSDEKLEGNRRLEQNEGVEMKISDKLTDVDSTIHVTQSGLQETSPVQNHTSDKECPAPVSKEFYEMNSVGRPMCESILSGDNEPRTDGANTTGEQEELTSNCDFEMRMSEKLGDASTKDPVSSFQLADSQGAVENRIGRKKSKAKKSTRRHELDMKNIAEASKNTSASEQDIICHDGSIDATTEAGGSIVTKTDVDHINEIGKRGKLSVTQGAETSLPSDNNKATGETKEQFLSAEKSLDDKGNIESGNASSTKRKKNSRKSAEKIPDKLDGEDDSRVNCPSVAAGIGPIADPVTEQSKKVEISSDAGKLQISLDTEVKGLSHNKDLMQVQSATCKSSDHAKADMTIKEVETASAAPSDVKVAEGHENSGRSKKKKTKKEVATSNIDVSCAPSAMHDPPANHFVQGSNQDKDALPATERKVASEQESKIAYDEKTTLIDAELLPVEEKENEVEHLLRNQTDKNQEIVSLVEKKLKTKTKTKKSQSSKKSKSDLAIQDQEVSHKELAASSEQESKIAYVAGSHQHDEKTTLIDAELLPVEEKENEVEHLLRNQTDKNQEIVSLVEKKLKTKTKTKKSQSSKKSKSDLAIQDQEVSHKELAASSEQESKIAYVAGSHQHDEKTTLIDAELLPVEEKENEVEHLLRNQTDKNQDIVSLVEKKLKTKTKTKKSQSSKKNKSDLAIQDQEVSHKELAASNDNPRDVSPLPEPMEMDESGKNSNVDQLDITKLENQRNPGTDSNSKSSGKELRNANSFRVPSHPLAKGTLEETHAPEVNTDKSESINFKKYFIPGQQQGEVASKKPTKSNRHTKAGRKSKKDGVTSGGTSEDILNSRTEVTVPSHSSVQGDKTLEDTGKLATFDAPASEKDSKEPMDESMSSSSSRGSDRFPENRRQQTGSEIQSLATKNTKMRTGDLEDCTPKRGVLPTSGPKFGDIRSRRSDCKGGGNSDSATETPSDYSSSSGYSVEGSEISQASTPNGANVAKHEDAGAKHKVKSNFLGQDITIDMILRSSSRFKKAKVMAAQCQDEESQPVDVVPDSLADTWNQ